MVPSLSDEPLPLKDATRFVVDDVNAAVGGEVTVTFLVTEAAPLRLSLTSSFTAYLPGAAYVWLTTAPVPVVPSPKVQEYDAMEPSLSVEDVPSSVAVSPCPDDVNAAVGSTLAASTVTGFVTVPVLPPLSVTVRVTL